LTAWTELYLSRIGKQYGFPPIGSSFHAGENKIVRAFALDFLLSQDSCQRDVDASSRLWHVAVNPEAVTANNHTIARHPQPKFVQSEFP
jgi:hypothetical protein